MPTVTPAPGCPCVELPACLVLAVYWTERHTALTVALENESRGEDAASLSAAVGRAASFEKNYDAISGEGVIEETGRVGFIYSVNVDQGVRGLGYGRLLMRRAADELVRAGAVAIYLLSSDADGYYRDPTGFYEKLGYEKIGEDSAGQSYMRLACP